MPYRDYGPLEKDYWRGKDSGMPHPAGFSNYHTTNREFSLYAEEVADIAETSSTILVVGCAFGQTVKILHDEYGMDSWGIDLSGYCINKAVTDRASQQNVLDGIESYDYVYNECVLSCLTDQEAQDACQKMRDAANHLLIHRLWNFEVDENEWYNVKSKSEWQTLCDSSGQDRWL